ncbi:hypothetical protein ABIB57_001582 [Devosia sp. UYZn731]|uniref:hypothetical protein n=1 Tax=Devosia sp. UYZn731 TaxID=3156345 RepID=UPI003391595A
MARKLRSLDNRGRWKPGVQPDVVQRRVMIPGGSPNDFSWIFYTYGAVFVEKLVSAGPEAFGDLGNQTTNKYVASLRYFLKYIATNAAMKKSEFNYGKVFRHLAYSEDTADDSDWKIVLSEYYQELVDNNGLTFPSGHTERSVTNRITEFSSMRGRLFKVLGWPDNAPYPSKRQTMPRQSKPSLGEISSRRRKPGSSEIQQLNLVRMQALRSACEDILLEAKEKVSRCQLVAAAIDEKTYKSFSNMIDSAPIDIHPLLLKKSDIGGDDLESIAVRYMRDTGYRGSSLGKNRLLERVSGKNFDDLLSYFEGTRHSMLAAFTILLIDTGINVEQLQQWDESPATSVISSGKIEVHTVRSPKPRANYKIKKSHLLHQVEDVSDKDSGEGISLATIKGYGSLSSYDVLTSWQELSTEARRAAHQAKSKVAGMLWIYRTKKNDFSTKVYPHQWAEFRFNCQLREAPLRGVVFTRDNIRPTFHQLLFSKSGGNADFVAAVAGHTSTKVTFASYLNKSHIRRLMDLKIIEFQQQFESIFGDGAKRAASLFIGLDEFEKRRASAVANGIGFYCSAPHSGFQPDTKGRQCWKIDACSKCPLLKFYPTRAAILELLWFKASLERASQGFITGNPERWVAVWLPALALCEGIVSLLSAGSKRTMFTKLKAEFEELEAAGSRADFHPW